MNQSKFISIFEIIDFENVVTLKTGSRRSSRLLVISPFDGAHRPMTSYWRSIVTIALSRVDSEIFNVKRCRDLEIGVRGHSRSLKVVPFIRVGMASY